MTIIGRLFEKWFGLETKPKCENCEYFRHLFEQELMRSERMVEMLAKLNQGGNATPVVIPPEAYKPLPSRYTPWSVVKNKLEADDRTLAEQKRKERQILTEKERIEALEKELDIKVSETETKEPDASDKREAV